MCVTKGGTARQQKELQAAGDFCDFQGEQEGQDSWNRGGEGEHRGEVIECREGENTLAP
jgi:hypothetical protein